MSLLVDIFISAWGLLKDSAIFILGGFLLAGVMKVFLPMDIVGRFLGGPGLRPVIRASVIGIPLPLCSCSVLPSAMALRKMGASRAATNAFLISTPESGVDSISISYALLDPIMAIFRPIAAFITALTAGVLENIFGVKENETEKATEPVADDCGCNSSCEAPKPENKFMEGLRYAFFDLMDDLAFWMVIGLLLAGVILTVIPDNFFAGIAGEGYLAMPIMLFIGVPMYICATSSTPMAAALIMKGLSPGAALVFLLAGPATNIGGIMIIRDFMGKRSALLYLVSIAVCSITLGVSLDLLYSALDIDPIATIGSASDIFPDGIETFGAVMFTLLAGRALLKKGWGKVCNFMAREGKPAQS
ncbi:Uncharacterized membrane protein, YraQ family [hydrothermal vent metagenome]|uniref:Uncharacterized membrane protein, YraQ family n=1 Tax=hydrothermal vent metagenome TaxID=652676 RepID=A0A3B1C3M0_9ZZZZ